MYAAADVETVEKAKLPYVYSADELISMFLAVYEREEAKGLLRRARLREAEEA